MSLLSRFILVYVLSDMFATNDACFDDNFEHHVDQVPYEMCMHICYFMNVYVIVFLAFYCTQDLSAAGNFLLRNYSFIGVFHAQKLNYTVNYLLMLFVSFSVNLMKNKEWTDPRILLIQTGIKVA